MKRMYLFITLLFASVLFCLPVQASSLVFSDDFESDTWKDQWTGDWQQYNGGISGYRCVRADGNSDGMLTSINIDTSQSSSLTIEFSVRKRNTDTGSDFFVYFYDGGAYNLISDLDTLGADNIWLNFSMTISDQRYLRTDFRIRFEARNLYYRNGSSYNEEVYVDSVKVRAEGGIPSAKCLQYTAFLEEHFNAGRAYLDIWEAGHDGSYDYYAVGSNEFIGNSVTTANLISTDNGKSYQLGTCSNDSGDWDGDGVTSDTDCNDQNAAIFPGAPEMCGDGIDQDCDGADLAECPEICAEFTATNDQHLKSARAYRRTSERGGCEPAYTTYTPKNNYTDTMGESADDVTTLSTTDNGYSYRLGNCQ